MLYSLKFKLRKNSLLNLGNPKLGRLHFFESVAQEILYIDDDYTF